MEIKFKITVKAILEDCIFINAKIYHEKVEIIELLDLKLRPRKKGFTITTSKVVTKKIINNEIITIYKPVFRIPRNIMAALSDYLENNKNILSETKPHEEKLDKNE